jgi:hypothetical protein
MNRTFFAVFFLLAPAILLGIELSKNYYGRRFVIEEGPQDFSLRYEDVYRYNDMKLVVVKSPDRMMWFKNGDDYFLGNDVLVRWTVPIMDLEDLFVIALKNASPIVKEEEVTDIAVSTGAIKFHALYKKELPLKITRNIGDVTTEMTYIYTAPLSFEEMNNIIHQLKYSPKADDTPYEMKVLSYFSWFKTSDNGYLSIEGYDHAGKDLKVLLSTYPMKMDSSYVEYDGRNFYVYVKGSSSTTKMIIDELSTNH